MKFFPNFDCKIFSAKAKPTPLARPWDKGPVVVSIPAISPYSGCPAVEDPICLKFFISLRVISL